MDLASLKLKSRTGRIILVRPTEAHDEAIRELRTHPTIRQYLRFLPETITTEEVRKIREDRADDNTRLDFSVHLVDDSGSVGDFVGGTGLLNTDEVNNHTDVGIWLSPNVHRGGIGTDSLYTLLSYAFDERGFHKVIFETGADNLNMRGWLEKVAGVTIEGTFRELWRDLINGGYSDAVSYGILEDQWRGQVKGKLEKRLGLL
ncbi:hypothetical protein D9758_001972 [Tetrapyrgos nigripes]|uniref:N-acetyltransferase domain-containing protein n=1 Tax=Tetrapyrgos nigripes TaxID=182062 RepID=A0A8H5LUK0_9AGAR|nr:hypothetical protein D9758_001972 [Tetrapyrgos nigripes]